MLKVGIVGIGGRMGHALWECCLGTDGAKVVCGIDKSTDTLPYGCNVEVVDEPSKLSQAPDLFIDFSRPECSLNILEYAKAHNCKVILGTTGFDYDARDKIKEYSKHIPIVFAANFSVGVNILLNLVKKASAIMADADIEIVEAHHRYKVASPSGTALAIGEAAAAGRIINLKDVMVSGRDGIVGERPYGAIGFSSIRGGDTVGELTAMFCSVGERLELSHIATSRQNFARGAFRAALWLEDKKPGLYGMNEVLGLDKA